MFLKRLALLLLFVFLVGCPRTGTDRAADASAVSRPAIELRADLPEKAAAKPVDASAVLGRTDSRKDLARWDVAARVVLSLRDQQGESGLVRNAYEVMDLLAGRTTPGKAYIDRTFPGTADKLRFLYVAQECLQQTASGETAANLDAGLAEITATIRAFCLASMSGIGRRTEGKLGQMAGVSLTLVREESPQAAPVRATAVKAAKEKAPVADLVVLPVEDRDDASLW